MRLEWRVIGNEYENIKWWTPTRNNESDYKAGWSQPCARYYRSICTSVSQTYCGVIFICIVTYMHYCDHGETQSCVMIDHKVGIIWRTETAPIRWPGDKSLACRDINKLLSEYYSMYAIFLWCYNFKYSNLLTVLGSCLLLDLSAHSCLSGLLGAQMFF